MASFSWGSACGRLLRIGGCPACKAAAAHRPEDRAASPVNADLRRFQRTMRHRMECVSCRLASPTSYHGSANAARGHLAHGFMASSPVSCSAAVMTCGCRCHRAPSRVILDAVREMGNNALMLSRTSRIGCWKRPMCVQLGLIRHMREMGIDLRQSSSRQLMASRGGAKRTSRTGFRVAQYRCPLAVGPARPNTQLLPIWPPPVSVRIPIRTSFTELSVADFTTNGHHDAPSRSKFTDFWIFHLSHRFQATDGRLIGFVNSPDPDRATTLSGSLPGYH